MKKPLLALFLFVIICGTAFCQQDPQWSQNMFNKAAINPGASGNSKDLCGTLFYRNQNMGFEGHPKTFLFNVNGSFSLFNIQSGAGLTVWSDQLGAQKTTVANLAYAYKRSLLGGQLGIGLNLGILNMSINNAWLATDDPATDPRIPKEGTSDMVFDMGLGVYFQRNDLYVGLSSLHLLPGEITEAGSKIASNPASVDWKQQFDLTRHYYIMAGYNYDITGSNIELRPSVFIKSDQAVPQFGINCLAVYNKLYWGGLAYRLQDAVSVMAGLDFGAVSPKYKKLKLGVAYDITVSNLSKYSSGSLEFFVRYCYQLVHPPKVQEVHSVRFL